MMFEFCQGGELFYHLRNYGTFKEDFVKFYLAELVRSSGSAEPCNTSFIYSPWGVDTAA